MSQSPSQPSMKGIKRAIISVADKTGVDEFARQLHQLGVEILSTGGTAQAIRALQVPVTDVSDYTGFPEMMSGRVKTLHPKVHGGILARRGVDEPTLAEFGIQPIDLVVVNLYPFIEVTRDPACTFDNAIEQIDIGGPALIRAAAKNHAHVAVVVDPEDYDRVIEELAREQQQVSTATRLEFAVKAFSHTSTYDQAIAQYLQRQRNGQDLPTQVFPAELNIKFAKKQDLRYGENPHQQAALYLDSQVQAGTLATAEQVQGSPLSYNNLADADAAYACVHGLRSEQPACVIVKHANPCGVAIGADLLHAYTRAYQTDPVSAFGGIIAFNQAVDKSTAEAILKNQFVEVIIAPAMTTEARDVLQSKPKVRVLLCPLSPLEAEGCFDYKKIFGGLLVQETDLAFVEPDQWQIVTQRQPTPEQMRDLLFSWNVAKYVKSNAIVYAYDEATCGLGAGQMSRVDSARLGCEKARLAELAIEGSVMASDAFFPFPDSVEFAAQAGVKAIIQPGGSIRDSEVIACADQHDLVMVFTKVRHFRH